MKPHAFWDSQPVRNISNMQKQQKEGQIERKEKKDVSETPLTLPEGFEWCTMNLMEDEDAE